MSPARCHPGRQEDPKDRGGSLGGSLATGPFCTWSTDSGGSSAWSWGQDEPPGGGTEQILGSCSPVGAHPNPGDRPCLLGTRVGWQRAGTELSLAATRSGAQWGPEPPSSSKLGSKPQNAAVTAPKGLWGGSCHAQGSPRPGDRGDLAGTPPAPPHPHRSGGTPSDPVRPHRAHPNPIPSPIPNPKPKPPSGRGSLRPPQRPRPPIPAPNRGKTRQDRDGGERWENPPPCTGLSQPGTEPPRTFFQPGMMTKIPKGPPASSLAPSLPGGAQRRLGHFTAGKLRQRRLQRPVSHGPGWALEPGPV